LCAGLADTLTVCDTKPQLAAAFAEELKHVTASIGIEVEIISCEKDEEVSGADIILLSAGEPRVPGVKMSRRDLALQNAKIVKSVSEVTVHQNPGAKYVVISNPVDAMAMVCKKYTKAEFVLSTGTNLESLRLRSKLAQTFRVSPFSVEGWVGGEHGDAATLLWSTVRIKSLFADEYAKSVGKILAKNEIGAYVKSVSKFIVDVVGGTEYGPAASFRDIARAITMNTNEILSVGIPRKFEGIPESVFVGIPTFVGRSLGSSLYSSLSPIEKSDLEKAAKEIWQTFQMVLEDLEQS
jgi:malate dehydrogenase